MAKSQFPLSSNKAILVTNNNNTGQQMFGAIYRRFQTGSASHRSNIETDPVPRPTETMGPRRFWSFLGLHCTMAKPQSVHDFTVKDAKGKDVDLVDYTGKTLLIVNVASECGLTDTNYTQLTELYHKYKDQGFEILAFPCNQFGAQEPGSNEQIVAFACSRFKAEYPIFGKVDVNGNNTAPIYKFLKKSSKCVDNIEWNFTKFLVDKDGHVVDRYAPATSPLSIEEDVKKLLAVAQLQD